MHTFVYYPVLIAPGCLRQPRGLHQVDELASYPYRIKSWISLNVVTEGFSEVVFFDSFNDQPFECYIAPTLCGLFSVVPEKARTR